jgi:hypothetical protein
MPIRHARRRSDATCARRPKVDFATVSIAVDELAGRQDGLNQVVAGHHGYASSGLPGLRIIGLDHDTAQTSSRAPG